MKLWKTLLDKTKDEWKKMKFSLQTIKKLMEMKKMIQKIDKQLTNFLERCSVSDHFKIASTLLMVYESYYEFRKKIQGSDQMEKYSKTNIKFL